MILASTESELNIVCRQPEWRRQQIANWLGEPSSRRHCPCCHLDVELLEGRQLLNSAVSRFFHVAAPSADFAPAKGLAAAFSTAESQPTVADLGTSHDGKALAVMAGSNKAPRLLRTASARLNPATGTGVTLSSLATDDGGAANLTYTWVCTAVPAGASAPVFTINHNNAAKNTAAQLSAAGPYKFKVIIADPEGLTITSSVRIRVPQRLTSVTISPQSICMFVGGTQQFTPTASDQFGKAKSPQPRYSWTASAGSISSRGHFKAPRSISNATITTAAIALGRSIKCTISVTVIPRFGDSQLQSEIMTLDVDGSLSRGDVMQILLSVGNDDGVVDSIELNGLTTILSYASAFHIPGYVQVLAGDVICGNPANASYQGQLLGNLRAGSSVTTLDRLVDKWFLGTDHPAVPAGIAYQNAAGSLFVNGPSYTDEFQGNLGDCALIASLGSLAKSNPSVIQRMIIDNGDNTWTVRFYRYDGAPDYVTVDRALPTDASGYLVYDGWCFQAKSPQNELWMPLVEKAYAEWNETWQEGGDGTNSYNGIQWGNPAVVYDQILGNRSAVYLPTFHPAEMIEQGLIEAITANRPLTAGTNYNPGNGLVPDHAYTVIGYNPVSDAFLLYNPWGCDQPPPLSCAQLQASVDFYFSADTSTSMSFGTG
jgi:hypothetical protein